jgi:imidazolonepropionase-like amidohydrolase
MQAITAATVNAADRLGESDNLGSLSVGKYGDIVAVKGNPLDNIQLLENISFVTKGGAVVKVN